MANTLNDVAQQMVRTFLVRLGEQHDCDRALPPLKQSKAHKDAILSDFDGRCAYCGEKAQPLNFDHLVPLNRSSGGLHAWGNVVPSCKLCNDAKGSKEWSAWMQNAHPDRSQKQIRDYVARYGYAPPSDARALAERLYQETFLEARDRLERFVKEASRS